MDMTEARLAAARGAELFDRMFTRTDEHGRVTVEMWGNYINTDKLDMSWHTECIAGQLAPVLCEGMEKAAYDDVLIAIENEMAPQVPRGYPDSWMSWYGLDSTEDYGYTELYDAWLDELESRTDVEN